MSLPDVLALYALPVWAALAAGWHWELHARLEARRRAAVARGEAPPPAPGLSGYERADVEKALHRDALITRGERATRWALWLLPVLGAWLWWMAGRAAG